MHSRNNSRNFYQQRKEEDAFVARGLLAKDVVISMKRVRFNVFEISMRKFGFCCLQFHW